MGVEMTDSLKIEVLVDDIGDGQSSSLYVFRSEYDELLTKIVQLDTSGKISSNLFPDYSEIPGLIERFDDIDSTIQDTLNEVEGMVNSYLTSAINPILVKKADLINNVVPFDQLPKISEYSEFNTTISKLKSDLEDDYNEKIDGLQNSKANLVNGKVPSSELPTYTEIPGLSQALTNIINQIIDPNDYYTKDQINSILTTFNKKIETGSILIGTESWDSVYGVTNSTPVNNALLSLASRTDILRRISGILSSDGSTPFLTELTQILSVYAKKADNLNDIADKGAARTNLSVYSKAESDDRYYPKSTLNVLLYSPIPYPLITPPSGFLVMMGQTITQQQYPILYSIYGGRLPDMRAYTIKGVDNGRGIDVGRVILSEQGDAIRNITGTFDGNIDDGQAAKTGAFYYTGTGFNGSNGQSGGGVIAFDASIVVPTASENRVKNIAFNYIVMAG